MNKKKEKKSVYLQGGGSAAGSFLVHVRDISLVVPPGRRSPTCPYGAAPIRC